MKTWEEIPEHIRCTFPAAVVAAFEVFTEEEAKSLFMAFSDETGEFEGVGFSGVDGRFTKFANPEKYQALMVIEEQCQKELQAKGDRHVWMRSRPSYYSTSASEWGKRINR